MPLLRLTVLVVGLLAVPRPAAAQRTVDFSQGIESRVLLDNEAVRMVEVRYQPGATADEHTHESPRTVYVVSGGVLELAAADGTVTQMSPRTGEALWRPAETHSVRNVGPTRVVLLETEIKTAGRP